MRFTIGAKTDVGMLRNNNEDAFYVDADHGLCIVADGMGGHQAGEVASTLAVETIKAELNKVQESATTSDLRESIERANAGVLHESLADPGKHGMGTTIVVAKIVSEDRLLLAHVGDSRAYAFSEHGMRRLTEDHSVVFQLIKEGKITEAEARFHPGRGALLRSLGVHEIVEIDTMEEPFTFDALLLCTDGLTEMLTDDEIQEVLAEESVPQEACEMLIQRANFAGGRDNITVILVKRVED